jgi:hypothetical protein
MQVKIALRFEFERHVRRLEKSEKRPVVHLKEGMEHAAFATGLGFVNIESAGKPQPEKVFVEFARLFGIAASIRAVMKPFDHDSPLLLLPQ